MITHIVVNKPTVSHFKLMISPQMNNASHIADMEFKNIYMKTSLIKKYNHTCLT